MKKLSNSIFIIFFLVFTAETHAACTVSATGINFGIYDTVLPTPLDSTGTITINCVNPPGPPPDVTISISPSASSGTFNPRQMKHTTSSYLLDYNLYTTKNRTTVWGDGAAGTATETNKGTNSRTITIFGSIPPGQNVPAGSYTDSITITITP